MSGALWLALGLIMGGVLAAAAVREERARKDLKGAKAFVKIARKIWHNAVGNLLVAALFVAAVVGAIVYLYRTGRPS